MKPRLVLNDKMKWAAKTVGDWLTIRAMMLAKFEGRKFDPGKK